MSGLPVNTSFQLRVNGDAVGSLTSDNYGRLTIKRTPNGGGNLPANLDLFSIRRVELQEENGGSSGIAMDIRAISAIWN